MEINKAALNTYKNLIQTTELQEGYQGFIKLFCFLRSELKKELPQMMFSNQIEENKMNFAYFQLTNQSMKAKGIKIQVIFVHKTCSFELWVSGYNRKIQGEYYDMLKEKPMPYLLNHSPDKADYIFKFLIDSNLEMDATSKFVAKIKAEIEKLIEYVETAISRT